MKVLKDNKFQLKEKYLIRIILKKKKNLIFKSLWKYR